MEQEILQRNKVIAEFMGAKFHKAIPGHFDADAMIFSKDSSPNPYNGEIVLTSLQYHSDWSWIMPVVRRVADLLLNKDWDNLQEALKRWRPICNELEKVNLENVHFCIFKFIEWYNSQVKETIKP